jgi:cation diffusion facilitator CzcD-associated flavoprotein CzcO
MRFIAIAAALVVPNLVVAKQLAADVIVIGAGWSGIGAAQVLSDNDVSYLVLEGRDRVGGRTWAETFQGEPYDLGGAWITGGPNNILHAMQRKYGLTPAITDNLHPMVSHFSFDNEWLTWDEYDRLAYQPYREVLRRARGVSGKSVYEACSETPGWDEVDQRRYTLCLHYHEVNIYI